MKMLRLHFVGAVIFGVAAAQNCINVALAAIPSCAQSCFLNGAPTIGCSGTDFPCQCEQRARMFAAVEGCVQKSCSSDLFQTVIDGSEKVCACATGTSTTGSGSAGSNTASPSMSASFTATPTVIPAVAPAKQVTTAAANRVVGLEHRVLGGVVGGVVLAAALAL